MQQPGRREAGQDWQPDSSHKHNGSAYSMHIASFPDFTAEGKILGTRPVYVFQHARAHVYRYGTVRYLHVYMLAARQVLVARKSEYT